LALEWKLADRRRSLFKYSTYHLGSGLEEEQTKDWFYKHVVMEPLAAVSDPVLAALMATAARRLTVASPGCVVLFKVVNAAGGRARRFLVKDTQAAGQPVSVYHEVTLTRTEAGVAVLFTEGSFILSRSAVASEWEEGRLPVLPPDCRYTKLGFCGNVLCAAWEQVDFYRVGRAGLVFSPAAWPISDGN
jgi:hypothetical protein